MTPRTAFMSAFLCAALVAAGCGDGDRGLGSSGSSGGGGGGPLNPSFDLVTAEVVSLSEHIVDLVALDGGEVGVMTLELGDPQAAICPECEAMNLGDQCPAGCRRDTLRYAVYGPTGSLLRGPTPLRVYTLPSADQGFGVVQSVRLSSGSIGVAWQLCAGPPAQSCALEYAVFAADGTPTAAPVRLYEHRYGDLRMAANPAERQVLLLRTTDLDVHAGVDVSLIDEAGATVLGWTRLGSSRARYGAAAAAGSGFLVATEERFPGAVESACPPCTSLSPDCISLPPGCAQGAIDPEAGIHAYQITTAGITGHEKVATGWGESTYGNLAFLSVAAAERPAVAAWSFGDRRFHLFARDGGWEERQAAAPSDDAPAWTAVFSAAQGGLVWLAGVASVGPALADTRSRFVAGRALPGADPQSTTTNPPFTGFSFGAALAFEGTESALVAVGLISPASDPFGYDHSSILRLRWSDSAGSTP